MYWYGEKTFSAKAQLLAKSLYYQVRRVPPLSPPIDTKPQGDISYLEAVNQATLANAFARYQELGILIARRSKAAKSVPLIALHPDWVPLRQADGTIRSDGKLWRFLERLGTFRREGKNRRGAGGSIVSSDRG